MFKNFFLVDILDNDKKKVLNWCKRLYFVWQKAFKYYVVFRNSIVLIINWIIPCDVTIYITLAFSGQSNIVI